MTVSYRANYVSEKQVVSLWQSLLLRKVPLFTENGIPLTIIYPGRRNDDRGADFRDVVIASPEGNKQGEIEFHVRSSDWQVHRHHEDGQYSNVILHVVMWDDLGPTYSQAVGNSIPTISLSKYLSAPIQQATGLAQESILSSVPCRGKAIFQADKVIAAVDAAGEARFREKTDRFRLGLEHDDAGQVLYKGIMEALGYVKNKRPFLELADQVPLTHPVAIVKSSSSIDDCLTEQQALLLGTAGFLPSQRAMFHLAGSDVYINRIEESWSLKYHQKGMSINDWSLYKVRPNNYPIRRLAAMSHLVWHYRENGLFEFLLANVKSTPVEKGTILSDNFKVPAAGYWRDHYDFGQVCRQPGLSLIGHDRAAEIVANILLPFVYAWGEFTGEKELQEKAVEIYRFLPGFSSNAIERHMLEQLGLRAQTINTASQQQGLLHIYRTLCTEGKCSECPINVVSDFGNRAPDLPEDYSSPSFNPATTSKSLPASLPA